MKPRHIIHFSGFAAFLAIATSAFLAYAVPSVGSASAVPNIKEQTASPVSDLTDAPHDIPTTKSTFGLPIEHALERVTKKTFAMEVHPETSPVPNDRFNGFHVGVDFETMEDEQEIDVPIYAICDGPLITKQFAKGYGGYALQHCMLNGEKVTILYGHLDLQSITAVAAQPLTRGETIGVLGEGYSLETDGVRKHLHLGVHRGTEIDIRGYVQETSEVNAWLDVLPYLQDE